MVSDRNQKIQDRAYEIWVENGRQEGTAERNWEQAAHEVGGGEEPGPSHDGHMSGTLHEASVPAAKTKGKAPKKKSAEAAAGKEATPGKDGSAKAGSKKESKAKSKISEAKVFKGKGKAVSKPEDAKPRAKKK